MTDSYLCIPRTASVIFLVMQHSSYVGFEVITAVVMKSSIFCDIMLCSSLKVNRRFGATCCPHLEGRRISQARKQREAGSKQNCYPLATWFVLVSCLAYSSTLKMGATYSSEMSVNFQWTTWHYIPVDRSLVFKYSFYNTEFNVSDPKNSRRRRAIYIQAVFQWLAGDRRSDWTRASLHIGTNRRWVTEYAGCN
jgi:hypothetical protein